MDRDIEKRKKKEKERSSIFQMGTARLVSREEAS
jgi:hypothetical protein